MPLFLQDANAIEFYRRRKELEKAFRELSDAKAPFHDGDSSAASGDATLRSHVGIKCNNQYGLLIHEMRIVYPTAATAQGMGGFVAGAQYEAAVATGGGTLNMASSTGHRRGNVFPASRGGSTVRSFNAHRKNTVSDATLGAVSMTGNYYETGIKTVVVPVSIMLSRGEFFYLQGAAGNEGFTAYFEGVEFLSEEVRDLFAALML